MDGANQHCNSTQAGVTVTCGRVRCSRICGKRLGILGWAGPLLTGIDCVAWQVQRELLA